MISEVTEFSRDTTAMSEYGSFAKKTRVGAATGGPVAKCPSILSLALLVVLTLGSCNALVYKIMYQVYGSDGAFFVSTGVNVLYIIYGGLLLYPRMLFTDSITPAMKALPKRRFIIMGFLDCCGTFLAAMGAVYTPGSVQTLLNQTLIPTTMIVSACFLRTHFSNVQLAGAALVLMGAAVTVLPAFVTAESDSNDGHGASPSQSRWYANLVFFASNLPVACSQVYKERAFKRDCVDVLYLTQWVSVFQFFFGLALAPLQALPGIGSAHGVPLSSIPTAFLESWDCFLEKPTSVCHGQWPAPSLLLLAFCAVNLVFNTGGLYVSKHGSAVLNVITYAVLLPVTTLIFSLRPLMGAFTEPLSASTVLGLLLVLLGFYLYQEPMLWLGRRDHGKGVDGGDEKGKVLREGLEEDGGGAQTVEEEEEEEEEEEDEEEQGTMGIHVPSFQERVVAGLGPATYQAHTQGHPYQLVPPMVNVGVSDASIFNVE